jgi:hypothetical protein
MIGWFANLRLFAVQMPSNSTIGDVLLLTRQRFLWADEHDTPIELLRDAIGDPNRSHPTAANFGFDFIDASRQGPTELVGGVIVDAATLPVASTGKVSVDILMLDEGNRLKVRATYKVGLFAQAKIKQMLLDYVSVLRRVVDEPDSTVHRVRECVCEEWVREQRLR